MANHFRLFKIVALTAFGYLLLRLLSHATLGEELAEIILGNGNVILIPLGILCAVWAFNIKKNGLIYGRIRITKEEYPQTYGFFMFVCVLGSITCLGVALYFSLSKSSLAGPIQEWAVQLIDRLSELLTYLQYLLQDHLPTDS